MRASLGCFPVLLQLAALAAQDGKLLAVAGEHLDTTSLVQLSVESRQPGPMEAGTAAEQLLGTGRKGVEARGVKADERQGVAARQAAAIEKVKEHHMRVDKLRKYQTAVDQLIQEETAATRKDKSSAGIPDDAADPPVVNLVSERFAVRAKGQQKLIQIPRALRENRLLELRVDAVFEHLGADRCSGAFMKSLSFFGNWTGPGGVVEITPGSDDPNTAMLIDTRPKFRGTSVSLKFGGITFDVEKQHDGRDGQGRSYLNVRVLGLKQHHDVGGILGSDDHTQAEIPNADCSSTQASTAMIETGSSAHASVGSKVVVVD